MGRISTVLALGAPLLVLYASSARAAGALEIVTEGANALFASPSAPTLPVTSSATLPLGAGSAGTPPRGAVGWPMGALTA
ncbi:MAG TPA: hypothetical protein VK762_29415, partial [Polyangiaceae bacterium]|nr:hypothetical protein [Polyangiaceae bacterium]